MKHTKKWKLLIGLINKKIEASSIVEVIVAMVIIIIAITGFFKFFVIINQSNKSKALAIYDYQCKVAFIKQQFPKVEIDEYLLIEEKNKTIQINVKSKVDLLREMSIVHSDFVERRYFLSKVE